MENTEAILVLIVGFLIGYYTSMIVFYGIKYLIDRIKLK